MTSIFQTAYEHWHSQFDQQKFAEKVREYLNTSPIDRAKDTDLREYFKSVRKAGIILGSAYHYCNEHSSLPKHFILFLRYLGKMNDAYTMELGNKYIRRLMAITEAQNILTISFHAAEPDDFRQRLSVFLECLNSILAQKELSISSYHSFRKSLRHVMNIFQIIAAQDPSNQAFLQTFQYLCDLNSDLGKIHDVYVHQELTSGYSYKKEKMAVPRKLKKKLSRFAQLLQRSGY